jgi:hypothetical protein
MNQAGVRPRLFSSPLRAEPNPPHPKKGLVRAHLSRFRQRHERITKRSEPKISSIARTIGRSAFAGSHLIEIHPTNYE